MAISVSLDKLLEAGAHFGHQARRWNPKMAPYLYGVQEGVHVFDLTKTKPLLDEALEFLKKSHSEGKVILFLGTKKQIKDKVEEVALSCGCPYVNERWLGGTFSNFDQMKRSLDKLADMKAKKTSGQLDKFTKKERLLIDREIARLERFFGGIVSLEKLPDVLIVMDSHKETGAVSEARRAGITIVGIVDSNSDPTLVDYPIPMNDDAQSALEYVLELMGKAISEGKVKVKKTAEAK